MITLDEDALICDLAETYHIFNYKELPLETVVVLSFGLKENSRIKMKMSEQKIPTETMLLAGILDRLSLLVWSKTEDAKDGLNRPASILDKLLGIKEEKEGYATYESGEDFSKAWNDING